LSIRNDPRNATPPPRTHVVGLGDLVLDVGHQRVLDRADPAVVDRGVLPGEVGVLRVDRHADDLDAALLELPEPVVEGEQLRGADKGEIQRVEEQHRVLVLDHGRQRDLLDLVAPQHRAGGEIRRLLPDEHSHDDSPFLFSQND
jgi:hypothetical protein